MSPRVRVTTVVALVAAAAAAAVVGVTVLQGRSTSTATPQERTPSTPPPLELAVAGGDADARALRRAEQAYERGDRAAARAAFEAVLRRNPSSVEAAVGAAVAAWPDGTVERLREIVARRPASGVARLHLGLALLAAGEREAAAEQWREAEKRDPDSPAAVRAEDLLHPGMPPGRPFFVPSAATLARLRTLSAESPLRGLEREAARKARTGDPDGWILVGAFLQRVGRPVSARRAYDRALAADPKDVEARAAAAVVRFDKDDPAQAFSRLGPLARTYPRSPVVRFHLGLLLLWIGEGQEARRQLRLAGQADPKSFHGREAKRLLRRLDGS